MVVENIGRLGSYIKGNQGKTKTLVDKTLVNWLATAKAFYCHNFMLLVYEIRTL